ncbi:Piwi-domain-containing protein [Massarina eburnea CBS 473.64]|uniref:Piwi-domain-containing protein n=1 Tax=Massarina eburnea CBS 473.64 TaxID=1395130 RepID=A0A6A6SCP4_9PLEO|nr:Piwi-domain-containing protein [Massarina eburnea CBS 473.64]
MSGPTGQPLPALAVPIINLRPETIPNFIEASIPSNAPTSDGRPYGGAIYTPNENEIKNRIAKIKKDLESAGDESPQPLFREEFRRKENNDQVVVNCFEVVFDSNVKFYEYEIVGVPVGENRAGKRLYMETIVEGVPFLRNNRGIFANDQVNTIVAWKNLHDIATGPKIANGDPLTGYDAEWRLVDIRDGTHTANINLRYLREVDVSGLRRYVNSASSNPGWYNPEPTLNALNTIITKCFDSTTNFFLNKHKFFIKTGYHDLSLALRLMRGYAYRFKPGMGKILLEVNTVTSAFWRPLPLSVILQRDQSGFRNGLFTFEGDVNVLRGLRVYILSKRTNDKGESMNMNDVRSRIKTIRSIGRPCNVEGFGYNNGWRTVAQHIQLKYNRTLQFPWMEAINLGTVHKPAWYAPEDLRILPQQIWSKIIPDRVANAFHNISCQRPGINRAKIELEGLVQLQIDPGTHSLVRCPPIRLRSIMLQIPCDRLKSPLVEYRGGSTASVDIKSGRWNLNSKKFYRGDRKTMTWKLFSEQGVSNDAIRNFTTHFNQQLRACGVAQHASRFGDPDILPQIDDTHLRTAFGNLLNQNNTKGLPDIVVLLLRGKNQQVYSIFKYLADKIFVFHSICVTENNFRPKQGWSNINAMRQYTANVAMKANLKMIGINHSAQQLFKQFLENTLILGADLTHPGSGAVMGSPSIAAVVGSVEANVGRFRGIMRLQRMQDTIFQFAELVQDALEAWYKSNKKFPQNVLYYRDGVSEGQYNQVRKDELDVIHKAFEQVARRRDKKVEPFNLTAVIVTKRHNTRFFPVRPEDAMNNNGNCKPGTLVDSAVTKPFGLDFFLQSHNGIKGTAKPTRYDVIQNDINISLTALQDFTHVLNHTYVRATLGVSYAAPAYYADRLCERGRCYLRNWYNPTPQTRQQFNNEKDRIEKDIQSRKPPKHTKSRKSTMDLDQEEKDRVELLARMNLYARGIMGSVWNAKPDSRVPRRDIPGRDMVVFVLNF